MKFSTHTNAFRVGRLSTSITVHDRLYVVRHEDLQVVTNSERATTQWLPALPESRRLLTDDRYINVTIDLTGGLWALDKDGAIYLRTRENPEPQRITAPDVRLAGHYSKRVGFVFDAVENRLVVVGGDRRNDSHYIEKNGNSIHSINGPGPSHGMGRAVATGAGVYYLLRDELWLLRGERWQLVARVPADRYQRSLLFADEASQILLVVYHDRTIKSHKVVALSDNGIEEQAGTIDEKLLLDDHSMSLGYHPTSKQFLLFSEDGVRVSEPLHLVSLGGIKEATANGPTNHWPKSAIPTEPRVVEPPLHWYREALALDIDEGAGEVTIPSKYNPDGKIVLGVFSNSPFLPLKGKSLLLLAHDPPYEAEYHELSFQNAFEVVITEEELTACLPSPMDSRRLFPLIVGPRFRDVDPAYAERVDTLCGGEPHRSWESKIGGFAALIQGGIEEAASGLYTELRCQRCYTTLRFSAQVNSHFSAMSGVLYLYMCPFGCSGAARVLCS